MSWEGLNRRKFPRANFPCMIKVSSEGHEAEVFLTHTENISVGGACVIIKRSLDLFSPVFVEIDLMDGGESISCHAKVVWAVRRKAIEDHKPSFYDIGVEFLDLTTAYRMRIADTVEHLVQSGRGTAWN